MSSLLDIDKAKTLQDKAELLKGIVRDNNVDPMVLKAYLQRQMGPTQPRAWSNFCAKIDKYVNQEHPSVARFTGNSQRPKAVCLPHDNPFQTADSKEKNPLLRYISYLVLGVAVLGVFYAIPNHETDQAIQDSITPHDEVTLVQNLKPIMNPVVTNESTPMKPEEVKPLTPMAEKVALAPLPSSSDKEKPMASKEELSNANELEAPVVLPVRPLPVLSARVPLEKKQPSSNQLNQEEEVASSTELKPAAVDTVAKAPEDIPDEAREEYVKALLGNAQSQALIASFYDEGHILNVDPSKALHWYTKAGENGHAGAQNHLGVIYFKGIGVSKDHEKASYWWTYAAKQGFAPAQNNLGFLYEKGMGVKQNYMTAAYWYRESANQGYARAQNNIAVLLDQGRGVDQDSGEALEWWKKSAFQGYAKAQNNLGVVYFQGKGVEQNTDEALKWWHKAARQDYARAQNNLGILYEEGQGVPKDLVMSYAWLSRAFVNGYDESGTYRAEMERTLTPSQLSMAQELIYGDINLMPGMRQWAGPETQETQTAFADPF